MNLSALARHRRLTLLQGPLGTFFRRLTNHLRAQGCEVHKINFNAGEAAFGPQGAINYRDTFERFEALDVGLDHFAAGAWARAADCIRGGHDEGLDRLWLFFAVVRRDGMDDLGRSAEPPGDIRADQRVRTLDLVVDRLANVVE